MHWVWPSRPVSPKRMSFAVCYTSAVKPGPAALSQFNSLLTSKKSKKALLHFISLPAVEIPSFLVSSLLSSYWSIRVFLSFPGLSQGSWQSSILLLCTLLLQMSDSSSHGRSLFFHRLVSSVSASNSVRLQWGWRWEDLPITKVIIQTA